ncbi:pyrroline-5-carboxylate reductase [Liquorilactobacillus hordei]|uniref:pyrroline-5-carboxylate reductase n=1 Tax=Liquorilactobacillus hordei TaxID=468911 RepID=UPI0039E9DFDF
MKIGFIGVGNMAKSIIAGWLAKKTFRSEDILVHSAHRNNYEKYAKETGVTACDSNTVLAQEADIILLAVKPFVLASIIDEISDVMNENKLIISMASGVSLAEIESQFKDKKIPIIRIMPNVNVEINEGMTAFVRNSSVTDIAYEQAKSLFDSLGRTLEIPEKDFSIFVALAGSSPAYIYYFIDAMARSGVKYGLTKKQATEISAQAVLGSAQKVLATTKSPMDMVDDVCSPGGTTIAGLLAMEEAGFMTAVVKGIDATVLKDQATH